MKDQNICYGRNSVLHALKNKRVGKLFIQKNAHGKILKAMTDLAETQSVPISYSDKSELDRLSSKERHQGTVAELNDPETLSADDRSYLNYFTEQLGIPGGTVLNKHIRKESKETRKRKILLMLDRIEDPHNLGAIIRTAAFYGLTGIIIPSRRSAGISPIVEKISSGGINMIPLISVSNLSGTVSGMRKKGFTVISVESVKSVNMNSIGNRLPDNGDIVMIFGSEGKGIKRVLLEKSDIICNLGLNEELGSLNVSVSVGIALYQLRHGFI